VSNLSAGAGPGGAERPAVPRMQVAIPEPLAPLVQIERLNRILEEGTLGPVTLVSAPAGWGKTVAICSWLRRSGVVGPVAWLTVERNDDGEQFWRKLREAIAAAIPHVVLAGSDPDGLAESLRGLREPLRLVLDDFHLVQDPRVMAGVDVLVRHSGGRLRLVMATRSDPGPPLPRWRMRCELTEVRADELSFTLDETEQLLALHGIRLPSVALGSLHDRTEGWPGGIQLAALAMKGHIDAAQIAEDFSGEDESVAQYLDAEVLASLAPETQDLLLCASVADHACGELADALTGRQDGEQQLADLRQCSAFLVPVESPPAWYRFHRLFGEMLRTKLRRDPERCRRLHERAAAWHASHDLPIAALRHALAAGHQPLAEALLIQRWPQLALCGCHDRGSLVSSSPWKAEPSRGVAWQTVAHAAERLDANDLRSADKLLRTASRRQSRRGPQPPSTLDLSTASLRLARARLGDDGSIVASAAEELLDLIDQADPSHELNVDNQLEAARTIAMTALGTAQLGVGDLQSAGDSLAEAAANEVNDAQCAAVERTGALALLHALRGDLRFADELAHKALALGPCARQHPYLHREPAYLALAVVHHEWNRTADAGRFFDLALRSGDLSGDTTFAGWKALIGSWLLLAEGNLGGAQSMLIEGRRQGHGTSSPHMRRWFAAAEAEVRTACGGAHAVPATLLPLLEDVDATSAPVAVALAHAYLRDGDIHAAARAIPQWSDETKSVRFLALRLDAGLVEAVTASQLGDAPRAAATLECVLRMSEPDGFRRVFVCGGQSVRDLLAKQLESGTAYWSLVRDLVEAPPAAPGGQEPSVGGPNEPLTERELTVLRFLQSVLSNEEIASKLFVSVNTVKTHVRNIYQKLDVGRRREAVRRARELRLL
jgi:LuxR family transcriptional regulator, maltose regulon positive regulatory protein